MRGEKRRKEWKTESREKGGECREGRKGKSDWRGRRSRRSGE